MVSSTVALFPRALLFGQPEELCWVPIAKVKVLKGPTMDIPLADMADVQMLQFRGWLCGIEAQLEEVSCRVLE